MKTLHSQLYFYCYFTGKEFRVVIISIVRTRNVLSQMKDLLPYYKKTGLLNKEQSKSDGVTRNLQNSNTLTQNSTMDLHVLGKSGEQTDFGDFGLLSGIIK